MRKRKINTDLVRETVKELCYSANFHLRSDVADAIKKCAEDVSLGEVSKTMLDILIENSRIAAGKGIAICQDTGMVMVFLELGQDLELSGFDLYGAVNGGVKDAYAEFPLRKSIVRDPILRVNTGDNIPAVIHTDIVPGSQMKISIMVKGFGSENKSRLVMLNPAQGKEGIIDFCVDTVRRAKADACPPYVLGVACGGSMERAAFLAKKALFRDISESAGEEHIAFLEQEILTRVNALGIGVMGLGDGPTALGVNVIPAPTHIAGLPVAVNLSCHALRTKEKVI